MTAVDERVAGERVTRREQHRTELAELLERDVTDLTDGADLVSGLALDSVAMMTLYAWLDERGLTVDTDPRRRPQRVGEVLTLLDKAGAPGLSVRLTDAATDGSPAAVQLIRPGRTGSPLAPVLETATIRFTPIEPRDVDYLYALSVRPETCFRWRYRGLPPSPEQFVADLWAQVVVQLVARRITDNRAVGHVVAYGADANRRYAYLAAVFEPEYAGTGIAAQAVAVFIRYLFHALPIVKLYLEVPGFNWPQVRSGEGRTFQVEGVLRDHDYYAGRPWDKYLCAIYREQAVARD